MLSARQVDLVQDSFALVLPITEGAAADFYRRLFALVPETRALFRTDIADQGRKLFLTLATVVDGLGSLERVLPVAEALAVRHVGYGVRPSHYDAVGACLIETLRSGLGDRFDGDTEAAWIAAYGTLAAAMLAAAYGHGEHRRHAA